MTHAEKITSSPELCDLAFQVEKATDGKVYFLYSTKPASTTYYVFSCDPEIPQMSVPFHERMTLVEATKWLASVLAWARAQEGAA